MKLNLKLKLLSLLVLPLFILSCEKDDIQDGSANELLSNGDLEIGSGTPNGWFSNAPCPDTELSWTEEEAFSPRKSLKISNPTLESTCFSFWGQSFSTDIPIGKSLSLSVQIKGQLEGEGVSIVIRGDDSPLADGSGEQFVTTQGNSPISGTFNWTEFSIGLGTVEPNIQSITVFLVYLPNTTGTVYFDDVSLVFE
ncbi:MAG: hypothetical protein HRU41_26770 [Saprospiraceae bacterium]|nr:hypothetical protein [Saprospiraceae bacterium]